MADLIVALSYFDRKIGPTVYIEYPERWRGGEDDAQPDLRSDDERGLVLALVEHEGLCHVAELLLRDQERLGAWSQGNAMCSIIFKEKLNSEKEHEVLSWVSDFVMKMHGRPDLFKAFYPSPKVVPGLETHVPTESDSELNQSYVVVLKCSRSSTIPRERRSARRARKKSSRT